MEFAPARRRPSLPGASRMLSLLGPAVMPRSPPARACDAMLPQAHAPASLLPTTGSEETMRSPDARLIGALLACLMAAPSLAPATDVDGPNDCTRSPVDFGDAPEEAFAYPGVSGHFPTCMTLQAAPGSKTGVCPVTRGSAPGLTGFVRHVHPTGGGGYWLGCLGGAALPQGIDGEPDGKMNPTGLGPSQCMTSLPVDCAETAFGMTFGQDENYGGTDAGVAAAINFPTCTMATVPFTAYNCSSLIRHVRLNVLVDWNRDGDWNDDFQCPSGCAYEWALRNVLIDLPPGCNNLATPPFLTGPTAGQGWMRITISDEAVNNDFPWAGSATIASQSLTDGETEDYPVTIGEPPCPPYEDWGDAPEFGLAYPGGVIGFFPTCNGPSGAGTQESTPLCPPLTGFGPVGYVRHISTATDPNVFWLGCGTPGVDGELDGKFNDNAGLPSNCNTTINVDCHENNWGMTFGQDECYGDGVDAGLDPGKLNFTTCQPATVQFKAFNCRSQTQELPVYLNILVDMNQDGDWNDSFQCPGPNGTCAYEWAVVNQTIVLPHGCSTQISQSFMMGPNAGHGWMRITLTPTPVNNNFPWNGSAGPAGQDFFSGGETEDYPVEISGNCNLGYTDFGDAPEGIAAYTTGIIGRFPTCLFDTAPAIQQIDCGTTLVPLPGPTGYVKHVALATDTDHFWLGCPLGAVDSENDAKMNFGGASTSFCNEGVFTDCTQFLGPLPFGQDECYGDPDAGLASFVSFARCSLQTVRMKAYNCSDHNVYVFLNILVDWNQDGDWADNALCFQNKICAPEWAVKNDTILLVPGCNTITSRQIQVGPQEGDAWMRITLSSDRAPDDFPWNGSKGIVGGALKGGETEDYPVRIDPSLVKVEDERIPGGLWLAPIVPNPAMNSVVLRYSLPRDQQVSLAAYDLAGRRLAQLASGRMSAGEHTVSWNFRDEKGAPVAAGYYVVKLRVGDRVMIQRGIRVR
jgi:GEVED domain-containing protein